MRLAAAAGISQYTPPPARTMTVTPATPTNIAVIALGENRSTYRATPGSAHDRHAGPARTERYRIRPPAPAVASRQLSMVGGYEHDGDHDRSHEEHQRLRGAVAERRRFGQRGPLDGQRHEQQAGQRTGNGGQCSPEGGPCRRRVSHRGPPPRVRASNRSIFSADGSPPHPPPDWRPARGAVRPTYQSPTTSDFASRVTTEIRNSA